jgi:hypothetical protein
MFAARALVSCRGEMPPCRARCAAGQSAAPSPSCHFPQFSCFPLRSLRHTAQGMLRTACRPVLRRCMATAKEEDARSKTLMSVAVTGALGMGFVAAAYQLGANEDTCAPAFLQPLPSSQTPPLASLDRRSSSDSGRSFLRLTSVPRHTTPGLQQRQLTPFFFFFLFASAEPNPAVRIRSVKT